MAVFQELAEYRQQVGLPSAGSEEGNATIAKLEMGDRSFFTINSGRSHNLRTLHQKSIQILQNVVKSPLFKVLAIRLKPNVNPNFYNQDYSFIGSFNESQNDLACSN